jgi:chemotaxis protein CheY-P-specific phosphatase CheC
MNATDKIDIITESISQTLEKTAFLEATCPVDQMAEPQDVIVAEIGFSGRISGKMQIASEREFVKIFAENISGIEDLTEEMYGDAMKELANITCGLVLPMIAESPDEQFEMAIPCLTTLSTPKWHDFISKEDTVLLEVENNPVFVKLEIK